MKILRLHAAAAPSLGGALEEFERQFVYPLGPGRSFRISHGTDYARFFRAIGGGQGVSFVAEDASGEVLGTLGVALRPMQWPDGSTRLAAYVGDLKVVRDLRAAQTLLRLALAAFAWGRPLGAVAVYGIVMDGTPSSPSSYTGRFGIPAFQSLAGLRVLRLPVGPDSGGAMDESIGAPLPEVEELYAKLSARVPAFAPLGGAPGLRSAMTPVGLLTPDRTACGVLEDTRLAKRLIGNDDAEMCSAHLSHFACTHPAAGLTVIREAMRRTAQGGNASALFVSIPASDEALLQLLRAAQPELVDAPATIFGAGLPSDCAWNVSTSEI